MVNSPPGLYVGAGMRRTRFLLGVLVGVGALLCVWRFGRGEGGEAGAVVPPGVAEAVPAEGAPLDAPDTHSKGAAARRSAALEAEVEEVREVRETSAASTAATLGRIWGRVELNGEPMQGFVSAKAVDGTVVGTAALRGEGRYEIKGVPPGDILLVPKPIARGKYYFAPLFAADGPCADQAVWLRVAPGETVERNLAFSVPLASITGHVRHADGTPATGQRVIGGSTVYEMPDLVRPDEAFFAFAEVGEEGEYELTVPYLAATFDIGVVYAHTDHMQYGLPPGARGIDFVLSAEAAVRVRAVDAETFEVLRHWTLQWSRTGSDYEEEVGTGDLDEEGWRIARVPAGFHDICVQPLDDTHESGRVEAIELSPALGTRELTVELRRKGPPK